MTDGIIQQIIKTRQELLRKQGHFSTYNNDIADIHLESLCEELIEKIKQELKPVIISYDIESRIYDNILKTLIGDNQE